MPHYTFCFARDLTGGQEQTFKQRLVGRHTGVTVDYWAASRLLGALLTSPEGQRITNHFYPDPAQNSRALMQAHANVFDRYLRYLMVAACFRGDLAADEHRRLRDCALARDAEGAWQVLQSHIDGCVSHVIARTGWSA